MRRFLAPSLPSLVPLLLLGSGALLTLSCAPTLVRPVESEANSSEAPFGLRDPREGRGTRPERESSEREERDLTAGMLALREGQLAKAAKAFRPSGRSKAARPLFLLGQAYVSVARGSLDEASRALREVLHLAPDLPAAIEAEGDLLAASGRPREALERYRQLLRLLPSDARARAAADRVRRDLVKQWRREADEALSKSNLDVARRAAFALVDLDSGSPVGYQILSRVAARGEKFEDAHEAALKARQLAPEDRKWAEFVAELAKKTSRFREAAAIYEELALTEPAFASKAEEARREFQIHNLPPPAQKAVVSPKLTRAQLAVLLSLVPEVGEAVDLKAPDVAVDIVDHADRTALARAIALGFLPVSRDTHRAQPEAPISRSELAQVLRRLAMVVGMGRVPRGCLASEPVSVSALVECGILLESSTRNPGGREALQAMEKVARMARPGREGGAP